MKKLIFLIGMLAFFINTGVSQVEKANGKPYTSALSDKQDVELIMVEGTDPDGRLKDGMSREHYVEDAVASFNKFVTPNDESDKISNFDDLRDRIRNSEKVKANWVGDRNKSEVNSTGWEGDKVYSFPRGPYPDEYVLVYKGYVWLSLACGNPMQDMRDHSENVTDIFGNKNYQKEVIKTNGETTINIFVNAEGGNVTNSGNSEVTTGSQGSPFAYYDPNQQPVYQQPVNQNTGCTNCNPCNNCNTQQTTQVVDNGGSDAEWENAYWSKKNYQANVANAVGTWLNFGVNTFGVVWNATHPAQNTFNNTYYWNGTTNPTNPGGPVNWPNGPNTNGQYPTGGPVSWWN